MNGMFNSDQIDYMRSLRTLSVQSGHLREDLRNRMTTRSAISAPMSAPKPLRLWVIVIYLGDDTLFWRAQRGGIDIGAWDRRKDAEDEARRIRPYYGRGEVQVEEWQAK